VSSAYLVLSELDRKKFGCTDRLRFNLLDITAREQATLQKAFGYHTPEDVADAMRKMVLVEEGHKVVRDPDVYLALTWLGLRQGDYLSARRGDEMAAELADLDIQIAYAIIDFEVDDAADDTAGKDGSSTPTRTSTP
jgi:hypothetical protein